MTDIVERLRGLRFVHVPVASELMDEAAAEIERLRTPTTHTTQTEGSVQGEGTLTDEERAALLTAADLLLGSRPGSILRNLLERLK
jgi:CBS domain-containing protein